MMVIAQSGPTPVTKREVRDVLTRIRLACRDAEQALLNNDEAGLTSAMREIGRDAETVEGAVRSPGVRGVSGRAR